MAKKKPKKGQKGYHAPPGIVARVNRFLRGIKIGLPAIGVVATDGLTQLGLERTIGRYTGFNVGEMQFQQGAVVDAAGFYAGNLVEQKVLSALRIPQMAGQKKILSVVGQYLPEIQAASELMQGADPLTTGRIYTGRSIGYDIGTGASWFSDAAQRNSFLQTLLARVGFGLISRFAGPFINPHLPKGVGI